MIAFLLKGMPAAPVTEAYSTLRKVSFSEFVFQPFANYGSHFFCKHFGQPSLSRAQIGSAHSGRTECCIDVCNPVRHQMCAFELYAVPGLPLEFVGDIDCTPGAYQHREKFHSFKFLGGIDISAYDYSLLSRIGSHQVEDHKQKRIGNCTVIYRNLLEAVNTPRIRI